MQNELKSAIRFNDFVAYFGARGVVVMAWWLGAAHAARIREDQNSFPFLQIVGAAGSGKSLLVDYLQKLNGQSPCSHSLAHATQAARARIYANAERPIVICEQHGEPDQPFDWDELKPLYSSGTFISLAGADRTEGATFKGALVITANQPLECSEAVSSRMVWIDLSAANANTPRVRPEAIGDLNAGEASAFGVKVAQSEDWIASTLLVQVPAYQGQLISKYGENLNRRTALNCAQMFVLLDLLSTLLSIPDDLRIEAGHFIHDIAILDTIPY
ncbi:hypothetical protein HBR93_13745 [Pseudomonas sp. WS 5411]|uniref:hypothetical protein n=1 Tax=Pseudomonas sp. WS 5411 TaxID=2717486 RepID=UPI0014757B6D|nr:hypothetical protein [Pseudomonas sp. WS 5411]NMY85168.1 hypothetical protein [Pseudomonas sp. WS 5411]